MMQQPPPIIIATVISSPKATEAFNVEVAAEGAVIFTLLALTAEAAIVVTNKTANKIVSTLLICPFMILSTSILRCLEF